VCTRANKATSKCILELILMASLYLQVSGTYGAVTECQSTEWVAVARSQRGTSRLRLWRPRPLPLMRPQSSVPGVIAAGAGIWALIFTCGNINSTRLCILLFVLLFDWASRCGGWHCSVLVEGSRVPIWSLAIGQPDHLEEG
jgi:hypothetical protein